MLYNYSLVWLWAFFGIKEPELFTNQLSFTVPNHRSVMWHAIMQPVRESEGVVAKVLALTFSFKPLKILIRHSFYLSAFVGSIGLVALVVSWLLSYSIPYLPYATAAAFVWVGVWLSMFMIDENRVVMWDTVEFQNKQIFTRAMPLFVKLRANEVLRKAQIQRGEVKFELLTTKKDPILKATVCIEGRITKFTVAVFIDGSEEPLCE